MRERVVGACTAIGLTVLIATLTLADGSVAPVPPAAAGPMAQATATPTSTPTPTPTPTATPTLPAARVYSDATTGAVWYEQSFPRANINCIVQTAGMAAGQFSCVPGTPVP